MKVGLIGFGKTGKCVAKVLLESKDTELQWVVRLSSVGKHISVPELMEIESDEPGLFISAKDTPIEELLAKYPVDIIVDFSSAMGIQYYGQHAASLGVTIISAVSLYPSHNLGMLNSYAKQTRVVHSPNITIGINFLIIAAKILQNIAPDADIEIIEQHFKQKPEVSGTAKKIAQALNLPDSSIKTIRAGGIIGVHEILVGFPFQTIRLKHESIAREAFGNGVLFIARNILGKPNGLYTMEDLLVPYFKLDSSEDDFRRQNRKPWWKIW